LSIPSRLDRRRHRQPPGRGRHRLEPHRVPVLPRGGEASTRSRRASTRSPSTPRSTTSSTSSRPARHRCGSSGSRSPRASPSTRWPPCSTSQIDGFDADEVPGALIRLQTEWRPGDEESWEGLLFPDTYEYAATDDAHDPRADEQPVRCRGPLVGLDPWLNVDPATLGAPPASPPTSTSSSPR
jgi:hypothetical protein